MVVKKREIKSKPLTAVQMQAHHLKYRRRLLIKCSILQIIALIVMMNDVFHLRN